MVELAEKVSFLEEMMQRAAYTQIQANMSIERLASEMVDFKDEMRDFKDEMLGFKNDMRGFKDEMLGFKDEMLGFKDEMLGFKDEMRDFKDEMLGFKDEMRDFKNDMRSFKDEMLGFKDEMRDFKDEMLDFKNEMRDFKDEMRDFKDEMSDFKDEMSDFKNEMSDFKNEMGEYKDWSKKQITRMNRQWGDLANKLGTVVEDIVAPNIPRLAKVYFGCEELDYIAIRVRKRSIADRSRRREFDTIAACEGIFILNETKSSPTARDVDQFAKFLSSGELFDYFPEYRECRVYPIFSSLYMDEALVTYLSRKGIYALAMKDDTMDILNFDSDVRIN